jgi:hypothetical protein
MNSSLRAKLDLLHQLAAGLPDSVPKAEDEYKQLCQTTYNDVIVLKSSEEVQPVLTKHCHNICSPIWNLQIWNALGGEEGAPVLIAMLDALWGDHPVLKDGTWTFFLEEKLEALEKHFKYLSADVATHPLMTLKRPLAGEQL